MNVEQRKENLQKMIEKYTKQAEKYEGAGFPKLAKKARESAMRAQAELETYDDD